MKYKITIEELIETQDSKYPISTKIFEQVIGDLDIEAVIKAVNKLV